MIHPFLVFRFFQGHLVLFLLDLSGCLFLFFNLRDYSVQFYDFLVDIIWDLLNFLRPRAHGFFGFFVFKFLLLDVFFEVICCSVFLSQRLFMSLKCFYVFRFDNCLCLSKGKFQSLDLRIHFV